MRNVYLILLNYILLIFVGVIDRFIFEILDGLFGVFLFYDIPKAFNSEIPYAYNPLGAIIFIFILSVIPFLLAFIKNNKTLLFCMVVYLTIEVLSMSFVSGIMGM